MNKTIQLVYAYHPDWDSIMYMVTEWEAIFQIIQKGPGSLYFDINFEDEDGDIMYVATVAYVAKIRGNIYLFLEKYNPEAEDIFFLNNIQIAELHAQGYDVEIL